MRKSLSIVIALVLMSLVSVAHAADAQPAPATNNNAGVVNINTADAAQLALLPRIGEKAAQRIVDYRKEHGPFRRATDLMQVKGVGAKTFELLSPYIALEGRTTLTTKVKSPRKPRANKSASSTQPATTAS